MLPGVLTDTVSASTTTSTKPRSASTTTATRSPRRRREIAGALAKSGVELAPDQVDLLLDSVLSGDLVRLVAVFNSAKLIDGQLGKLMTAAGENIERGAQVFRHARGAVCHAGARAGLGHREDRHASTCRSSTPS